MKCYVLEEGQYFNLQKCKSEEASEQIEKKIEEICVNWQVRDLHQEGNSNYGDDDISSKKLYEALNPENFVITNDSIVGYYANHFGVCGFVKFNGEEMKKLATTTTQAMTAAQAAWTEDT